MLIFLLIFEAKFTQNVDVDNKTGNTGNTVVSLDNNNFSVDLHDKLKPTSFL
jgi:hypothetical protein